MPSLPNRTCASPGCGKLCTKGARCTACEQAKHKARDLPRGTASERGYDADHNRLRVLAFQRDLWTCKDCGWRPQIIVDCEQYGLDEPPLGVILAFLTEAYKRGERHFHGDHIEPIERRPELRLDLANYATRCDGCHNRKTLSGR
jgi:5-methylcytosine-specific restriction protein A